MKKRKNKKINKIKALVFDIGGVLQLPKYPEKKIRGHKTLGRGHRALGVHEYVAQKLGVSLDQYFDSIDTTYAMSIEGEISEKEVVRILSMNFKIAPKKLRKLFYKAYKKNFKLNRELIRHALRLKKEDYKIAILSDQWHLSKEALVIKKLTKNFNPVMISCESGIRKPNLDFYRLVLRKLKLPAKQVLFIDNQQWNIKPAKKLGMKVILFKNNKQLFKRLSKQGIK